MGDYQDVAEHNLSGMILKEAWKVKNKFEKTDSQTGSTFSVGYVVAKDGKDYFLKAFNVNAFSTGNESFVETYAFVGTIYTTKLTTMAYSRDKK